MLAIDQITLNTKQHTVTVGLTNKASFSFTMEFLRVIESPNNSSAKPVSHKKSVQLSNIESIGKHGLRLLFDDGYSRIVDAKLLSELASQQEKLWQEYLAELKKSGLSREATIDIIQVR